MAKHANTGRAAPANGAAATAPVKFSKVNSATAEIKPSQDDIRKRAYELYCRRIANGATGDAQSDWAAAERELTRHR